MGVVSIAAVACTPGDDGSTRARRLVFGTGGGSGGTQFAAGLGQGGTVFAAGGGQGSQFASGLGSGGTVFGAGLGSGGTVFGTGGGGAGGTPTQDGGVEEDGGAPADAGVPRDSSCPSVCAYFVECGVSDPNCVSQCEGGTTLEQRECAAAAPNCSALVACFAPG
jgi:hypothetical protein